MFEPPSASRVFAPIRAFLSLALAALLAFGLFYATRSAVHSWDSIAYTARAHDDPLLSEQFLSTTRFHPHHLLYVPLAEWVIEVTEERAGEDPFAPLLLLSCVAGALCVLLGGWIAWRVAGTLEAALATTGFLMLANSTWLYSTIVEVMMPAIACLFVGVALLTHRPLWVVFLAALAVAAGVLLHQMVALYAIVLTLVLLPSGLTRALVFGVTCAAAVVGTYAWIGLSFGVVDSLPEVVAWTLSASPRSTGLASGIVAVSYQAVRTGAEAIITLVPVTRLRAGVTPDIPLWVGAGAVAIVGLTAVLGWIRALRAAPPDAASPARAASAGLLWGSVLTALFIAWFQARVIDYWVYVVAALGVWAFSRLRFVPKVALLIWLLLLGGTNYYFRVLPMRSAANAPYAALAQYAEEQMEPGDRFWLADTDTTLEHALVLLPFLYKVEAETVDPVAVGQSTAGRSRAREWALGPGRLYATSDARGEIRRAGVREWAWSQEGQIGETPIFRLVWAVSKSPVDSLAAEPLPPASP